MEEGDMRLTTIKNCRKLLITIIHNSQNGKVQCIVNLSMANIFLFTDKTVKLALLFLSISYESRHAGKQMDNLHY